MTKYSQFQQWSSFTYGALSFKRILANLKDVHQDHKILHQTEHLISIIILSLFEIVTMDRV